MSERKTTIRVMDKLMMFPLTVTLDVATGITANTAVTLWTDGREQN